MRRFIGRHEEELDCIDVVVKSEEHKQKLWKTLEKQARDVYITSSVKQLLEISDINAGKDAAAKFLAGYLGLNREERAGFGDGHNDRGLLKYAGIGFAVANASAECREAADRIVASNDEDGVAEGIRYILKINAESGGCCPEQQENFQGSEKSGGNNRWHSMRSGISTSRSRSISRWTCSGVSGRTM